MSNKEDDEDQLLVDMLVKGLRPESRYILKHLASIFGENVGQYTSDMIDQKAVEELGEGADQELSDRYWRVYAQYERNTQIKQKAQDLKIENQSEIDIGEP